MKVVSFLENIVEIVLVNMYVFGIKNEKLFEYIYIILYVYVCYEIFSIFFKEVFEILSIVFYIF